MPVLGVAVAAAEAREIRRCAIGAPYELVGGERDDVSKFQRRARQTSDARTIVPRMINATSRAGADAVLRREERGYDERRRSASRAPLVR